MRPDSFKSLSAKLLTTTAMVALIAGAPVALKFDSERGTLALKPTLGFAKDHDPDSDRDSDRDRDSSGPGSDGGDRDNERDSSGPGSGDADHDSDRDDDGDDGDDNDEDDDEDDDEDNDEDDDKKDVRESRSVTDSDGTKIEITRNSIEITYPDGTKEEVEDGVYERKDATGKTVEERPATQTDRARMAAAARALESSVNAQRDFTLGDGTKIEVSGNDIEITYSDGWKEEIDGGRFEMKDPNGNTVIERRATEEDRARLQQQIPG